MKSVMTPQQQFAQIAKPQIQRSKFDRSHGYKTTFNAGQLIPIFIDEALPGDTFNLKANFFGRLATLDKPIMDNIFLDYHFFTVPVRILWENWKRFHGEQTNPGDSVDFIVPTLEAPEDGFGELSIYDYMGVPTKVPGLEMSALFNRAINTIWNEWFRDQNFQQSVYAPTDDGPDIAANYTVLPRGKRKDYFTSALPQPQKGPGVVVPIGGIAPVETTGTPPNFINGPSSGTTYRTMQWDSTANLKLSGALQPNTDIRFGNQTGLQVNLAQGTQALINDIRTAFQIQRVFERDARGGTRYTESIRAHFGVISPDARLQRPEFLGGGTVPINVNPIAQNSETADTPQGNLAAMGTFSSYGRGFHKSFTEHEIVVGFISARADLNYQQGLDRMFSRSTRFDFFLPTLAHLGEQGIKRKELVARGTTQDEEIFGYTERFNEYRYKTSKVTGLFRSNAAQSLDVWHLSQDFGGANPVLGASFIQENPPIDRVVAVPSEPHFIIDCYFDYKCARPMPTYSTPGLIDHF